MASGNGIWACVVIGDVDLILMLRMGIFGPEEDFFALLLFISS